MKYLLIVLLFALNFTANAQTPIDSFYSWKPLGIYEKVDTSLYGDKLVHRFNPRDGNLYECKVSIAYVGVAYVDDKKQYGILEKVYVIEISEL